jgi:hypothetical protein
MEAVTAQPNVMRTGPASREAHVDMDQRLGRLREPRYLMGYLVGGLLALAAAIALHRVTNGALPELTGAVWLGGMAASAQLAKGYWESAPRRATLSLAFGVMSGALLGALSRL